MTETYPFTPCPAPTLADICALAAEDFARLSREAYRDGDEPRGDRLFHRSLKWALAGEYSDLTLVRQP